MQDTASETIRITNFIFSIKPMKNVLLLTALLCGLSFASFASDLSSISGSNFHKENVVFVPKTTQLSPKRLATGSFTANGMTFYFCYDTSIPGDFANALAAAIAYAAWYSHS